ncbi:NADH-quinone oxidoreductase subunit L [Chryseolinea sp. T2]|uniref:NADH-quinone oxidoreductase subunit 5 family protein n=1 Tax=Chryseolinea sp. T2 TaxID=3129255 RepID=UPI0030769605
MTISAQILSADTLISGVLPALLLPLISAIVCLIVSEKYGWVVAFISPLFLLVSAAFAVYTCYHQLGSDPLIFNLTWFSVAGREFDINLLLNNISTLMMSVVSVVSFLVHVYSIGYMADDAAQRRYFSMLGLFTFAMLGIVVSGNFLLLFMFWELVGFSSYMLIGHWYEKPEAADAAKRAFLFNRLGDAGFVVGLMAIWSGYGTFNFADIDIANGGGWQIVAGIGVLCGVLGKSAQFPLFGWLPKAMEGPTPVSALIHAATMVAAGVYLLDRVFWIFAPPVLITIAIIGASTALIGACAAIGQHDMKRILAYSTMSQLGLMVMAVGMEAPFASMLHLITHAFFKAGLFLAAGCIIHTLHQAQHHSRDSFDVQDIRNLGGLRKRLPFTFVAFLVCGSALAGLPFFAGFLSKEAILEAALHWASHGQSWRWLLAGSAFVVSFLTPIYTFRMIWKIFMDEEVLTQNLEIAEAPPVMRFPLLILSIASLWFAVSFNPFDFNGWVFRNISDFIPPAAGASHHPFPWLSFASIFWIALALALAYFSRNASIRSRLLYEAFYFDKVIHLSVELPINFLGNMTRRLDRKWIDGTLHTAAYTYTILAHVVGWFDRFAIDGLVDGVAWSARMVGYSVRRFQREGVQLYIFWALFAIIIFIIWTLL